LAKNQWGLNPWTGEQSNKYAWCLRYCSYIEGDNLNNPDKVDTTANDWDQIIDNMLNKIRTDMKTITTTQIG